MLADGLYDYTDERISGGIREKDEIETERIAVSEGYWAGQTG